MTAWIPLLRTGGEKLTNVDIVCVDKPNNKVHCIDYANGTLHRFVTNDYTTGEVLGDTLITDVTTISGNNRARGRPSCVGADGYFYTATYTSGNEDATAVISKIDPVTREEVDTLRSPLFDEWGGTDFYLLFPFTLSGTQYLMLIMDSPEGLTPNINVINAATMTSVDTDDYGGTEQTSATKGNVEGEFFLMHWDAGFTTVTINKAVYTIGGGLIISPFTTIDPADIQASSAAVNDTGPIVCDPATGDPIVFVDLDDNDVGDVFYAVKLDKDDGSVIWAIYAWMPSYFGGMVLASSDMSEGTLLMAGDTGGWMIVDLTDGSFAHIVRDATNQGSDDAVYWDSVNERNIHFGSITIDADFNTWSILNTAEVEKPYMEYLIGGSGNASLAACVHPTNPDIQYLWRERIDFLGYELVSVSVATGALLTQGDFFPYATIDVDLDIPVGWSDLSLNSCLRISGDGLLVFMLYTGSPGPSVREDRVAVFDAATLTLQEIVDGYINNVPGTGQVLSDIVPSETGRYLAAIGDYYAVGNPLVVQSSSITLWDRNNDSLSRIDIIGDLGLDGLAVGGVFDPDDNLWILEDVKDGVNGLQHRNPTKLHKLQVTGGMIPSLTLLASHEFDDMFFDSGDPEFSAFASTYLITITYNPDTEKFVLISSYTDASDLDETQAWFWTFDLDTLTDSVPVDFPVSSRYQWEYPNRFSWSSSRYFAVYANGLPGEPRRWAIFDSEEETYEVLGTVEVWSYDDELVAWVITCSADGLGILTVSNSYGVSPQGGALDALWFLAIPEADVDAIGGSGAQMEPEGIALELQPFALGQFAMNSCIELGPFRFAEQRQADETALISSLILGVSQQAIGIVVFEDWLNDDLEAEDWNEEVDQDGDDIYEDWSEGSGDSDDFTLQLRSTDDGISAQFQGDETLDVIEDFGSSKQYAPVGYSAIMHRLHICAREVDEYWSVKTIDIAGVLTGRHL